MRGDDRATAWATGIREEGAEPNVIAHRRPFPYRGDELFRSFVNCAVREFLFMKRLSIAGGRGNVPLYIYIYIETRIYVRSAFCHCRRAPSPLLPCLVFLVFLRSPIAVPLGPYRFR